MLPLSCKEDALHARRILDDAAANSRGLVYTRFAASTAFARNVELCAALYLTTNLLAMGRSVSGTLKIVSIELHEGVPPNAIANAARASLAGIYSTISNYEDWVATIEEVVALPRALKTAIDENAALLRSYSRLDSLADADTAEVLLHFRGAGIDAEDNSIAIDEKRPGKIAVTSSHGTAPSRSLNFSGGLVFEGSAVQLFHADRIFRNGKQSAWLIDCDTEDPSFVSEWVRALRSAFEL